MGTKEYHAQKSREWYQRTKEKEPEKLKKRDVYAAQRRREAKHKAVLSFGGVCAHCGGKFLDCVFEFHHLNDSEKEYTPSHLFALSPITIDKELAKCIMLCANCHRIEHDKLKYTAHSKRLLGSANKD